MNIDERSSHYQGVAYLNETNKTLPSTAAWFHTENKNKNFQFRTDLILPIDPPGIPTSADKIRDHYTENVGISNYADVNGSWESDSLKLSWTTNSGTKGNCTLPLSMADKPSELVAQNKEWGAFKEYVASLEGRRFLFRGQNKPWRLRTSFHRANRADLTRFLNEDIQVLHKHLSARTKHVFNLENPNENGAFFIIWFSTMVIPRLYSIGRILPMLQRSLPIVASQMIRPPKLFQRIR
ncbi:MAG: hypothetical protein M0R70_13575 [Nitrospirae bacterium]|nr:hypothetical protein [Nitrospirota bacterium]